MAKSITKTPGKTAAKTGASPKPKTASAPSIEKVSEDTLKTLQTLGIDQQLQADLEWCLGSYRSDQNPSGLYEMMERAKVVLNAEKAKKTKGVTAKTVGDLEKVLKSR